MITENGEMLIDWRVNWKDGWSDGRWVVFDGKPVSDNLQSENETESDDDIS